MNGDFSIPILVAEDNIMNQKLITTILSKCGISFRLVENGLDAVNLYQTQNFKMILMDCQMPEMDGFVATKRIREYEKVSDKPRIPIIALTANAMKGDRDRCIENGMDDFLSKPFRMNELISIIEQWNKTHGGTG